MSFELREHTHIYKLWYVELGDKGNLLGMVLRDPPDEWRLEYRFRWYRDKKVFNSDDERSFYGFKAKEPDARDRLVDSFDTMLAMVATNWPNATISRVHIDKAGQAARDMLLAQPWAHTKAMD